MKRLAAGLAALVLTIGASQPAVAFVAEVTTSIAVADADDQAALRKALQAAVDDVLKDAIAFTPTLVVLTRAQVVRDRLYIRVLVADAEGEQAVKDLTSPEPDSAPSASPRTDI